MVEPRLIPAMINVDLAISLLGLSIARARQLAHYSKKDSGFEGTVQYELAAELQSHFEQLAITEVQRGLLEGSLRVGQIVGVEQSFYFKRSRSKDSGKERIRAWNRLNTDRSVIVEALIDPERLVFSSAHGLLSGQNAFYIVGLISAISHDLVRIRPVFIGWRSFGLSESDIKLGISTDSRWTHPSQLDQFALVDFDKRVSKGDLAAMAAKPEKEVKESIAKILGEPYVPLDWGGERSDMFTTQARVDGRPLRSAWLLKGRSVQRPMQISDLGKNGDQIDRLFTEPADLYVVQSNQPITSAVRNMLDVYAHDYRRPSTYMTLDGADTARVLIAHGLL